MFIFANAFNDVILILLLLVVFTQVVIPVWRNKKVFPLFRKAYKVVETFNNEGTPATKPVAEKQPAKPKPRKPTTKQQQ